MLGLAEGRLLFCLEGGYNLDQIGDCAVACAKAILGQPLDMIEWVSQ